MHKSICYQIIRLQELEKQMVGGENKDNKTLKEKRKKRKLFADERKQRLAGEYQYNCKTRLIHEDFIFLSICKSLEMQKQNPRQ